MHHAKRLATMLFSVMAFTALAFAGQVASPNLPQAQAEGTAYYTGDGVHIRKGTNTSTTSLGLGYKIHKVWDYSYTTGQSVSGNPYWIYHQNLKTYVKGYSSNVYLPWSRNGSSC